MARAWPLTLLLACGKERAAPSESAADTEPAVETAFEDRFRTLEVRVTLDGAPAPDAVVTQGGVPERWTTDAEGKARITLDTLVLGALTVMASHPEARIDGVDIDEEPEDIAAAVAAGVDIALVRYDTTDNEAYTFQDPGEPSSRDNTSQCGHCHIAQSDAWYDSAHRSSARNPVVHDLYAGTAAAWDDEATCLAAGGRWWEGLGPGTGEPAWRCYLGTGALPALNADCGTEAPCDGVAARTGGCADCHAPGLDGKPGGRDLLEATGYAWAYGVHCDVCHRVESVDLTAEPGVAGRLRLLRPSEESPSPALGEWAPLTFGPYPDVMNPRMGSVARDLFHESELCAGCHQLESAPMADPDALDADRWPGGLLPIQTTYAEWLAGPYGGAAHCQSCHMPPDAASGNSADLGTYVIEAEPDSATGWYRPSGQVRLHTWTGPRTPGGNMLQLAAFLALEAEIEGEELVVRATVQNAGAGHGLPTGEPMRTLVLLVEATCDGEPVAATGGDAVPDFGGWLDRKVAGEDWSAWPGAEPGDRLRVIRRTGDFHAYTGYGPFGDGTFDAEARGMPVEEIVGESTILAVDGDTVTLDAPLPEGDVVYRGEGQGLPEDGDPQSARAGAPGFAFGRILVDAAGNRHVPTFLATDVASDNRLPPRESWTSTHRFAASCAEPQARAVLYYRAYPLDLARERGWDATETWVAEAVAP